MAIIHHVISTQLAAYRAAGGGTVNLVYDAAAGASIPAVVTDNTAGVFGNKVIQIGDNTHLRGIQYPGGANMPANAGPITVRVRIQPRFTGAPSQQCVLWAAEGFGTFNTNTCWFYLDATSKLNVLIKDVYGKTYVNVQSVAISPTLTSGTPVEFMFSWDGSTTAGKVGISMNGVQVSALTATAVAAAWDRTLINMVNWGWSARFNLANFDLIEGVIYDTAEAWVYTPNVTFVTDTAFDASTNTDPGVGNVRNGTAYTIAGAALTGTVVVPSLANTKTGVAGDGGTGTYDGSDRWSDPGITNVRSATAYKANNTANNRTGSLDLPAVADVRLATTFDGATKTGTARIPGVGNVKTGFAYDSSDSLTGTYDGSDRWTDPGIANVRTATAYKANNTANNRTGTAAIPTAANVRAGTNTDATVGTLAVPAAANVRNGTAVDAGTGTAYIPAAADVRSGTNVDATTGSLDLPATSAVKTGVTFDGASKTGTYDGSDRWTDPGVSNVRSATAYKANSTSNNRTGTAAIPVAANVRAGTATDATTGSLAVPAATDVRRTVAVDAGTGTAYIPTAANVRAGTSVDATVGTLAVPAAGNVRSGVSVDAGTGTLVAPSLANTKVGVAGDGGTGTYDGSDRWSDPGSTNVKTGVAYKANSLTNNETGSYAPVADFPAVTNVRLGTAFNDGNLTGTLDLVTGDKIRAGYTQDNGAIVGTLDVNPDLVEVFVKENENVTIEVGD